MTFEEYLNNGQSTFSSVDEELKLTRKNAYDICRKIGYSAHDAQAKTRSDSACYAIVCIFNAYGATCVEHFLSLKSHR